LNILNKLTNNKQGERMNKEIENGFMLIALKPFNARGLSYKVGDRVSARMTFTQAIKKSKQYNIGHTVGCDKRVEVKPYINFKSSWQKQERA
tara:strand:- start:521 stop:796 length:276 start_codon:yes stop_codon:yes gene_type:complete